MVTAQSPRGVPITIMVTPATQYGCALLQATGSVEHLEALLNRFQKQGLRDWQAVSQAVSERE